MSLIDIARKIIAVDSTPSNGTYEVAKLIGDLGQEMGFDVDYQEERLYGIAQQNVILRSPTSSKKNEIMFLTHLDTPDPGNYGLWTKNMGNPFNACIYEETVFGLGVAGAKLDFISKMLAAQKYLNAKQKRPFALVGTFGGQQYMVGAVKLLRRKKVNANFALIGEPTDMKLTTAGSGLTIVEVSFPFTQEEREYQKRHDLMESSSTQSKLFRGEAGLASQPLMDNNAIVQMIKYLENLPQGIAIMDMDGGISPNTIPSSAFLEIDIVGGLKNTVAQKILKVMKTLRQVEEEFSDYPAEGFETKTSTLNIGQVRRFDGGIKVNGSCRILPSVKQEQMEKWLENMKNSCEEQGARFQIVANFKPFRTNLETEAVKGCLDILKDCGLSEKPFKTTVCTEANVLSHLGVEVALIGPGFGIGNTHRPNENIKVSDLEKATEFYSLAIERLCL